jgi:hypothetical protein
LRENGFGGEKGLEGNAGLSSGSKGGSKGEEEYEMCEGVVGFCRSAEHWSEIAAVCELICLVDWSREFLL